MINGKFLITLVGIVVAILALCNMNFTPSITENFWGGIPTRTFKVDREIKDKAGNFFSMPGGIKSMAKNSDFFTVPGTFQTMPPPRMYGGGYPGNINYNMPSQDHLAVPKNPISVGQMVKEDYCTGCGASHGVAGCRKGGLSVPDGIPFSKQAGAKAAKYINNNYQELRDKLQYTEVTDVLPAGDMTTVNALGIEETPIIFDRYMYANQRSRLYGLGDPIRGDLPIVPCNTGWFQVSVHPHIDLRDGAMSVMGGVHNDTNNALHELQNAASGGLLHTLGGVDYGSDVNAATSTASGLSAFNNDVTVTAFP